MRISFIPKTKAKVIDLKALAPKQGQKDLSNAARIRLLIKAPNSSLDMLDKKARAWLYEKGNVKQNQLEAVEVVSDTPSLSNIAIMVGDLNWAGEQTGCKLTIHQGVTGDQTIRLKDGIVNKVKTSHKEGGTIEWTLDYYTTDVDAETYGALCMLIKREVDIELEASEVFENQKTIDEANKETPEKALAKAVGKSK